MNERRVIQAAVILTALLCVFIVGFSVGRSPETKGVLLLSSVPAAESIAAVSEASFSETESAPEQSSAEVSESEEIIPFDLNTATEEQLISLPGIGEELAGRIIAYRDEVGAFVSVDELLNVKGIGEKKLADIRPYLYVNE